MIQKHFANKAMMINPKMRLNASFQGSIPACKPVVQEKLVIIPIHGVLTKRSGILDEFFGTTSYEEIYENIANALSNPDVSQIVLDIDTPGGETSGLFDLCDFIYSSKTQKLIIAHANDDCFSAGYAIASSCSKILVTRTSGVGSIGVIATHLDQKEYDKKEGLTYTTIFKGARKNDLNPHETITNEALTELSNEVDRLYEMFVILVARNRNISVEAVKATEAGVFYGVDAVKAGLADEMINSFESGIFKGANMNINTMIETLASKVETVEEKIIDTVEAVENAITGNSTEDNVKDEKSSNYKDAILEITKLCKLAKMPEKLAEFIESESSIEEARDFLMKALASKTDDIRSMISSSLKQVESPVITAARSRQKLV